MLDDAADRNSFTAHMANQCLVDIDINDERSFQVGISEHIELSSGRWQLDTFLLHWLTEGMRLSRDVPGATRLDHAEDDAGNEER